jgi:hypothetical protein
MNVTGNKYLADFGMAQFYNSNTVNFTGPALLEVCWL